MIRYPIYEFFENTYEIDEFDCMSMFLFVGTKKALLLDTGIGIGNIREFVESITDKPYDVVLTHGHMDHVGGACLFDRVYINPKDRAGYEFPPSLESRKNYAHMIWTREHKYYPYEIEKDIQDWQNRMPEFMDLKDGQAFDLGGRTLTFYECAGHTPGEMVAIDSKSKTLFCGDACNNNLLFLTEPDDPNFVSVEDAGKNLERIWQMRDHYDGIMNSHHDYRAVGYPISPTVMPNAIQCCQDLVSGTPHLMTIENPLKLEGRAPTIEVASLDGHSWVCFNPKGIYSVH